MVKLCGTVIPCVEQSSTCAGEVSGGVGALAPRRFRKTGREVKPILGGFESTEQALAKLDQKFVIPLQDPPEKGFYYFILALRRGIHHQCSFL